MKKAQARQKKYADQKRREIEFAVADMVYLKVVAIKGKGKDRFGKTYEGPFPIIARVSEVAYCLALPKTMGILPVFHVSMLRKHVRDPQEVEPTTIEEPHPEVTYPQGPLSIGARRMKKLRNKQILQIQVTWGKQHRKVVTWEDEAVFRRKHPKFFTEERNPEEEEAPYEAFRIRDKF